jgi:hypothetical protein
MPFLATSLYGVRGNEWVDVLAVPALPLRLQGSSTTAAGTGSGSGSDSSSDYYTDGTATAGGSDRSANSGSSSSERAAVAAEQERRLIVRRNSWWRSDSSSSSSSGVDDDSDADEYDELYVLQEAGGAQAQQRALLPHRQLGYLNGQLYMSGGMLPRRGGQLLLPGTQVYNCSYAYPTG